MIYALTELIRLDTIYTHVISTVWRGEVESDMVSRYFDRGKKMQRHSKIILFTTIKKKTE